MKPKEIRLGKRSIGSSHKPFVIAEMSGNHNQSLDQAIKIVDAAAACGVDALKIQTYTAETMTLNLDRDEFVIRDPKSLWNGRTLFELYQEAHTPWDWHQAIFDRCHKHGIIGFSSPFDFTAVDFLEELGAPLYKIASFELIDLPLIEYVATTGKPMIMSTGMATAEEISDAVEAAHRGGCQDLVLLKCTSTYPASPENTNILTLPDLFQKWNTWVGISDHTLGCGVSVASVALGACVIEKHFTLDRSEGGVDSAFSLEPNEMKNLVLESERAWQALGRVSYGPTEKEKPSLQFRRSLYIVEDMKSGEVLSQKNMRCIRPGHGLPPKYMRELMGKKITRDIKKGTPLAWDWIAKA